MASRRTPGTTARDVPRPRRERSDGCRAVSEPVSIADWESSQANCPRPAAMETAYRGSKYKSEELPLFYMTMANVIDDVGKPDEAVRIYKDAIKILEDDKSMRPHLSSLQYNLGITLLRIFAGFAIAALTGVTLGVLMVALV